MQNEECLDMFVVKYFDKNNPQQVQNSWNLINGFISPVVNKKMQQLNEESLQIIQEKFMQFMENHGTDELKCREYLDNLYAEQDLQMSKSMDNLCQSLRKEGENMILDYFSQHEKDGKFMRMNMELLDLRLQIQQEWNKGPRFGKKGE
jgi:prenyltransferase beta subunit